MASFIRMGRYGALCCLVMVLLVMLVTQVVAEEALESARKQQNGENRIEKANGKTSLNSGQATVDKERLVDSDEKSSTDALPENLELTASDNLPNTDNLIDQTSNVEPGVDPKFKLLLDEILANNPDWSVEDLKTGFFVITQPYGTFAIVDSIVWLQENMDVEEETIKSDEFQQQFLDSLFGRDPRLDLTETQKSIYPIIRDVSYFKSYQNWQKRNGRSTKIPFAYKKVTPELRVLYLLDKGAEKQVILKTHLKQLKLNLGRLHELAIENLTINIPKYEFFGSDDLRSVKANGLYEASFILIKNFWHPAHLGFEGVPVVFVPRPNILFITTKKNAFGQQQAINFILDPTNEFLHIMSVRGYEKSGNNWKELRKAKITKRIQYHDF